MWLWIRRKARIPDDPRLKVAEAKVTELEERAERVVPALIERRQRNHWGETIAAISHARERHS